MKTMIVALKIEVPDEFGSKQERALDQVFADTLYEEGYRLVESMAYEELDD